MSIRKTRKQKELIYSELRVAGGVNLFVQPQIVTKIINGLQWCCDKRGLRIYDYCILPDKILLLANTAWGNLNEVLESYKAFSSKAVMLILRRGRSDLKRSWMLTVFQEHGPAGRPEGIHIWEDEMFTQPVFKQNEIDELSVTIHKKPVVLGLVQKPEHYLNSSAHPANPLQGWIVEATDPWS
ncbi:MAG: hypothetical protein JJU37_06585 [Balneolaceae bacterium]|nr:hypothetical protein [Balneolaceae bacterium]